MTPAYCWDCHKEIPANQVDLRRVGITTYVEQCPHCGGFNLSFATHPLAK